MIDVFVTLLHVRLIVAKLTWLALHAYACDCVTHHLFHPYGTNCLENTADETMMHQVAADDSLQSTFYSFLLFTDANHAVSMLTKG